MFKRKFMVLALTVVFVVSLTAFAVIPGVHTTPAPKGVHTLAALKVFEPTGRTFRPPSCPDPGASGCGGGG